MNEENIPIKIDSGQEPEGFTVGPINIGNYKGRQYYWCSPSHKGDTWCGWILEKQEITLQQIFIRAAKIGEMPKVKIDKPVRHSELTIGTITQIRPTGIAVRFPDMNYDVWFWFELQSDKRSKYTNCLSFYE